MINVDEEFEETTSGEEEEEECFVFSTSSTSDFYDCGDSFGFRIA
jgi:hypothetical protein